MAYGKIDLSAGDIAFLKDRLGQVAERIAASRTTASSIEERAFYERAAVEIDQWIATASRYVAGARRFEEADLRYLRGAISESAPGTLASRLVEARRSGDPALGKLEAEYQQWVSLSEKLVQPFVRDRSHDAEAEDEEDGD